MLASGMTLAEHQQDIHRASHDTAKQRLSKDVSLVTRWLLEKTPEMTKKSRNEKDARFWSNELLDWLDPIQLRCESLSFGSQWRELVESYVVDLAAVIHSHALKHPLHHDFMANKADLERAIDAEWDLTLLAFPHLVL